jgi:gluconolactonase
VIGGAERLRDLSLWASGLDHPECVTTGPDGTVYAGGEDGQIYRIDPDERTVRQIASIGSPVGGVVADGRGCLFACDPERSRVVRIGPDGRVDSFVDGGGGRSMVAPNYLVFDQHGSLFVSDSGAWGKNDGLIWKVSWEGTASVFSEDARQYPNGLAIDPTNTDLYVIESSASRVVRMPLGANAASNMSPVVTLPGTVPDGLAFDAAGNLFIACYRPDRIYRLRQNGDLDIFIDDWAAITLCAPTNITFFGPTLERMAIASLAGRTVYALPVDDGPGMPLHYPAHGGEARVHH